MRTVEYQHPDLTKDTPEKYFAGMLKLYLDTGTDTSDVSIAARLHVKSTVKLNLAYLTKKVKEHNFTSADERTKEEILGYIESLKDFVRFLDEDSENHEWFFSWEPERHE